jgi:hypothetical protein
MGHVRHRFGAVPVELRFALIAGLMSLVQGLGQSSATAQRLPPPPTIPVLGQPSSSPGVYPAPQSPYPTPEERIYTAPSNPNNGGLYRYSQPTTARYRVYVDSDSPYVLQQIRAVEPSAFLQSFNGRRVIQTGTFNSEANARQQVALLSSQGVDARITTRMLGQVSYEEGKTPSGYYAIVPADPSELPELRNRAVESGVSRNAIRLRNHPIGPHMAVGPYGSLKDAEIVTQFLRDRKFDARTFYDR